MSGLIEGPLERLRRAAPFWDDPEQSTPDVRYDGPLASFSGSDAYTIAMAAWRESVPARLEDFKVDNVQVFSLSDEVRK